ncbi:MAG: hypothetical protein JOZ13_12325 [Alphaproteobacteria bacterium]|nr:hypothetical protein [Alphaproteobacteria bacterium]
MNAIDLEHVQMSAAERDRFALELAKTRAYFELGMGGSTLMAARSGVGQIVSVDSDNTWIEAVRAHKEIAPRCADGSMSLLYADIGPVADWGRPADRSAIRQWSRYISAGWAEWARRECLPDLVLVDGRFRIACCLSVALATAHLPSAALPRILLHDVDEKRAHYREALECLEQIDQVETMLIMKPNRNTSPALVLARVLEKQFDFT